MEAYAKFAFLNVGGFMDIMEQTVKGEHPSHPHHTPLASAASVVVCPYDTAHNDTLALAAAALGVYPTKHLWWTPMWEEVCYPPTDPALRARPMQWAAFMLVGKLPRCPRYLGCISIVAFFSR